MAREVVPVSAGALDPGLPTTQAVPEARPVASSLPTRRSIRGATRAQRVTSAPAGTHEQPAPGAPPVAADPGPAAEDVGSTSPAERPGAAPELAALSRNGLVDAVIETDGRGFPALSSTSRLDWLSPDAAATETASPSRPSAAAWLSRVRAGAAGVDLRSAASRRVLPQVGVIAVMAVATVGNVMAGQDSPTASAIGGASTDFARSQVAILPGVEEGTPVTSDLDNSGDLVAGEDGVLRVRGADGASRGGTRDVLPGCDGIPPEVPLINGDLPEEYLCSLPGGTEMLRADAAEAFALLKEAYAAENDRDICVTSGYRSYAAQAALRRQKPGLAAPAGSSQHGEGLAIDLCGGIEDESAGYWWLREHAPAFGFDNPEWARRGGSKYEPWHWEYVAGRW